MENSNKDGLLQVLAITAEENYAHARDHEHLRSQITAILASAAFLLIGIAIDKSMSGDQLYFVTSCAIILGFINIWLINIHNNRFKRHVEIAREAKIRMIQISNEKDWLKENMDDNKLLQFSPTTKKLGSLSFSLLFVASLPVVASLALLAITIASCR